MSTHPAYPAHGESPYGDRCECGGIRYWHGGHGCDDCDCGEFQLVDEDRLFDEHVDRCLAEGRSWKVGA